MKIYSKLGYIFFDSLYDQNENISITKVLDSPNKFNFQSDKLGSFDVEFSSIENHYGIVYDSETKFESIFLNGSNLTSVTSGSHDYKRDLIFIGS